MKRLAGGTQMLCMLALSSACVRGGCTGCSQEPLAVLTETRGGVERDLTRAQGHWSAAKAGARFDDGDGLRTGVNAIAVLRVGSAGQAQVEGETTIRFRRGLSSAAQRLSVEVEAGTATLLSGREAMGVQAKSGKLLLAPGGSLRVSQSEHVQRYEVVFGRASIAARDGKTRELTKGQVFEVEIGLAELERKPAVAPVAAAAAASATATSESRDAGRPAPSDTLTAPAIDTSETPESGLDYADVVLRAGASVTIYDPRPPTAVGFNVSEFCPDVASLRVGSGKLWKTTRGKGQLSLGLAAGSHGYRISCGSADAAHAKAISGTVWVVRKDGTDKLPRTAPSNAIDLDGRRYTVIFQNLPPSIQAHWSKAPAGDHFTLHASLASGKTLALNTRVPSYAWKPGEIPEGENRLYFESATPSAQRSRETTVVVKFDNAAPTASLRSPPVDGFAPASSVAIEGVAVPGSSVSVDGQALALDAQQRFAASVAFAQGAHALAIRIEHPRTGVRYYVRRPAGAR